MRAIGWFILFIASLNQAMASCEGAFIARQDARFSAQGDYWYQGFEVPEGSVGEFVFRVVAVGSIDATVIDEADVQRFIDGQSVGAYSIFSQKIGTQGISLPAGNYAVALRNRLDGESRYSIELDCDKTYSDATRIDAMTRAEQISAGAKYYHSLTVNEGYRLWVDGVSLGLETFIIPSSQLSAFTSNQEFQYYTDFGSIASANQPGGYEIKLSPGEYYLALRNLNDEPMPVTFTIELFQITDEGVEQDNLDEDGNVIPSSPDLTASGMTFEGQSSVNIANGVLSAEIASLANYSNQSIGPLTLLWLASKDGEVNGSTIIARKPFTDFNNSDGVFTSGSRYTDITLTTEYTPPSYGQYQVILVVVDSATETMVYDKIVYSNSMTLGEAPSEPEPSDSVDIGSESSGDSSSGGGGMAFWIMLLAVLVWCKRRG